MQIEALDVAHLKLLGPVGQGDVRGFSAGAVLPREGPFRTPLCGGRVDA